MRGVPVPPVGVGADYRSILPGNMCGYNPSCAAVFPFFLIPSRVGTRL
jgi:hypothetical protein